MLLNAVILPPRPLLDPVVHVVRSVVGSHTPSQPPPPSPPPRSGFLRRGSSRAVGESVPPQPSGPLLDLIPSAQISLPIAGFGNVTPDDASRIAATLTAAAADWPRPTVWLAGGGALEFPGDRSVWVKLAGDTSALADIARGVTKSVESRGFFVDRRRFRPWLAVATITDWTTAPFLEEVVAALEAFRGEEWTIESVTVTKPSFEAPPAEPKEVYRIPLAASPPA